MTRAQFPAIPLSQRPVELRPARPVRQAFYYFLSITALHGILGRLIGYFLPIYFRELGFSGVQTGLYFSVATVSTLVLSLPMGITTDRRRISSIFVFSSLLVATSYVGFIFTRSFAVFCAFAFVGSFGSRFYGTAKNSMFFKITRNDDSRDAGLYQLVNFTATGVGMLLGGLIIAGFSFRHVFVAACVGNVVIAGLSWFLPRTETLVIKLAEYRRDVLNPRVLFITFVFVLSSLHHGAEMVAYGRFLRENLGLSLRLTGAYTAGGFALVGVGAFLGAVLLRRRVVRGPQDILAFGFLLAGVFHVLMCVQNPWLSFAMRAVHEIGDGFVMLAYYHGIAKIFHISKIGGCAAFMTLCMGLGGMGSSVFSGYIADTYGNQWPLIISGVVLALLPLLLAMSRHKFSHD